MRIKKLQINYEVRYNYSPLLNAFINSFPSEHRKVRVDNIVMPDGSTKEDWVRIIRDVQIGNLIVFLIDNSIEFILENLTQTELRDIKKEYNERQDRIKRALKLKDESLNVSNDDYSFMCMQPYEYQKKAVKFFEINKGISILGDAPGVGKQQPLYSKVATPFGWKTMGEIKVGDKVLSSNGMPCNVLGVFPQGIQPSYRISFDDGTFTECGMDHLWLVRNIAEIGNWKVMTLRSIVSSGNYNQWRIPISSACEYEDSPLESEPYIKGLSIEGLFDDMPIDTCVQIPVEYKISSIEQRIELLRGMLRLNKGASLESGKYRTSSENLSKDVAEIIRSLGWKATIHHGHIHEVTWNSLNYNSRSKAIVGVTYVGDVEQQCIMVDSLNNTYLTDDHIVTHNTMSSISYATKNKKKALVICPASLKFMWRDEVTKFTNEKAHIFRYFPTKKSKQINFSKEESLFHVINYEGLSSFIKLESRHVCEGTKMDPKTKSFRKCGTEIINLTKKMTTPCPSCGGTKFKSRIKGVQFFKTQEGEFIDPDDYDLVIIDEFHRMKNPQTDWTQIIKRALSDIPEKLLLSGTAIKSRPMELFAPLNFLDPKTWNDKHAFGLRFCAAYEDKFGWIYDGVSNTEELYGRISPFYLRRLKKDILPQLPDKTFTDIRLELEPSEMRAYSKIEKETKKIKGESDDVKEVPKSFMEKIHQLKLLTETVKLDRAKEFINDIIDSNDKLVIFFDYLPTAQRIKDLFGDRAVIHTGSMSQAEKHESVTKFQNDKKINIFGGTIMSAGVGITLTAANKLMFIGQAWTSADMIQCQDRIHRANTKHDNIQIITYLCNDTIDMHIYDFLKKKQQVVSKVLDNVDDKTTSVTYSDNAFSFLMSILNKE